MAKADAHDGGEPTLYVGFRSALDFWRGVSNLGDWRDCVTRKAMGREGIEHMEITYDDTCRVRDPAFRIRDVKDLGVGLSPDAPLDVLVSQRCQLRRSTRLESHLVEGKLPKHSFVRARGGVLVASPEATFVQLASQLTLPQLLLVGMELCGTYAMDGSGDDGTGFSQRPRLITVARLAQYVHWCHGRSGIELARQAVGLLMENSGSPRESITVLSLTMPTTRRGLGLPKPRLNRHTHVTRRDRKGTSQSQYYYDFYWEKSKVVGKEKIRLTSRVDGEYDSDEYHSGTMKLYDDARRGNSVQYMGTAHVVITDYDLRSARRLIRIARQISRQIWHRLPSNERLERLEPLLDDLLDELKSGIIYPVSIDKNGNLPKHRRPQTQRGARGHHGS